MWERDNTFSPNINNKSRSMTRTVDDLYNWNEQKQGKLKLKKTQIAHQSSAQKVKICPGSATIIKNLDELVGKCSDKIDHVRNFSNSGTRNNSHITEKHKSLSFIRQKETIALKANKINVKKNKSQAKKKIKCKVYVNNHA